MPAAKGISSLPLEAQASISRSIGADLQAYQVRRAGADPAGSGIFAARNARNELAADFTAQGVVVHSATARWKMSLTAYGYGDNLKSVTATAPAAKANRVEYRRGALTEWYVNGPMGLEQGFTIAQSPGSEPRTANSSRLTVALALSGDPAAKIDPSGRSVILTGEAHAPSLRYAGLTATDANGKELPASLELRGQELLLKVNDGGARYPVVIDPFVQLAELTASDGAGLDELGYSVAVSGKTAVAGALGSNSYAGAVYLFVEPESGWANMTQTAKLTASDAAPDAFLGCSVAISGNTVVAGARGATDGGRGGSGAVYVFVEPAGGWADMTETARLAATSGGEVGLSVALSGGTIVAGADDEAYVFVEPKTGWVNEPPRAELTASDQGGDLGYSVSISGYTVVAGAPQKPAVYVFVKPATGWADMTQTAELTAPLQGSGDLGISVAITGSTVVGGSPTASPSGKDSGAVDVFVEPATGWVNMTPTAVLTASDGKENDLLGSSVTVSGNTVIAGAPNAQIGRDKLQGAAYVFVEPAASGWVNMTQTGKLPNSSVQGDEQFGWSVALVGNTAVVGVPNMNAAYVFGEAQ